MSCFNKRSCIKLLKNEEIMHRTATNSFSSQDFDFQYDCSAKDGRGNSSCIVVVVKETFLKSVLKENKEFHLRFEKDELPKRYWIITAKSYKEKLEALYKHNYAPRLVNRKKVFFEKKSILNFVINNRITRTCYQVCDVFGIPTPRKIFLTTKEHISITGEFTVFQSNDDSPVKKPLYYETIKSISTSASSSTTKKIESVSEVVKPPIISENESIAVSTASKITDVMPNALGIHKHIDFPITELEYLLFLLDDLEVADLLNELADNTKRSQKTFLGRMVSYAVGFAPSSIQEKIVNSSTSLDMIMSLFGKIGSTVEFYNFFTSDKTNEDELKNGGKFGQAMLSFLKFKKYINEFNDSSTQSLNIEKLAFALLQDKPLAALLADNASKNEITRLIKALQIPQLDHKKIAAILQLISDTQKLIQLQDKHFTTYSELTILIKRAENKYRTRDLLCNGINLIFELEDLLRVFCDPDMQPVQHLLNFTQEKKLFSLNSEKKGEYYDLKKSFQNFKDASLGIFVSIYMTPPLQTKIHGKSLDDCFFSSDEINQQKAIITSFEDDAFEDFSFKDACFVDFDFINCYFQNCDFSNAVFSKSITFENVYMDQATANSFAKAISESSKSLNCELVIKGQDNLFVISSDATNENISLELHGNSILVEEADSEDEYQSMEETDEVIEVVVEEASQESVNEEKKDNVETEGGLLNSFYSGFQDISSALSGAYEYLNPGNEEATQKAQTINEEIKKEQKNSIQIEKDLNKLKRNLDRKLIQMKNELNGFYKTAREEDKETIEILKYNISDHMNQIQTIGDIVENIISQKSEKRRILSEQSHLLNHKSPQVRVYYQTLVSGICAVLYSFYLSNNDQMKILGLKNGKALEISNIIKRDNGIFNRIKGRAERIVELIDVLSCIVPSSLSGPLDQLVKKLDQNHLQKTQEIFRGLTPRKLDELSEIIARKVASSYEEQILKLSKKSAIHFAEDAIQTIAAAFLSGQVPDDQDIETYVWLSIRHAKKQNKTLIQALKFKGTPKLISPDAKTTYSCNQLYQCSGIAYKENSSWLHCALKESENKEFGYFRVTNEERIRYFDKYYPVDDDKSVPDDEKAVLLDEDIYTSPEIKIPKQTPRRQIDSMHHHREELESIKRKQYMENYRFNQRIAALERELKKNPSDSENVQSPKTPSRSSTTTAAPSIPKNGSMSSSNFHGLRQSPFLLPIDPIPVKVPSGLYNIFNSCYMNASLQVLFNLPPVLHAITSYQQNIGEREKGKLIACFRDLLLNQHRTDSREHWDQLKNLRAAFFDYFGWNLHTLERQHDAQEFFQCILELADFQKVKLGEKAISKMDESQSRSLNSTSESMLSISIKDQTSFQKCIDNNFMREERTVPLENDLKGLFKVWYKQTSVDNAPDYLFIQLKRFEFHNLEMGAQKITTAIEFPADGIVNIQRITEEDPLKYEIISYISHKGEEANSGHYTSIVKSAKDNNWYSCDDETSKMVTLGNISSKAYILVLKKRI